MTQSGEEKERGKELGNRSGEEIWAGKPKAQGRPAGRRPGYLRSWDWDSNKLA